MFKTLIVDPHEYSVKKLLQLPVWGDVSEPSKDSFVCIQTASNGVEAQALVERMDFDLILTEINLPELDGLQLLKKIQQENSTPLIVFISDMVSFSIAREAFIYGLFDYLPKPINQESLEKLFARAAEVLTRYYSDTHKMVDNIGGKLNFQLSSQIAVVVKNFLAQNRTCLGSFQMMMRNLIHMEERGPAKDMLFKRIFASVVKNIYNGATWLELYLPQSFYKEIDLLNIGSHEDLVSYYLRKLTLLYGLYIELMPRIQDDNLKKVCLYLLENPEEDLRLTAVSDHFYLNHTYLSNLFSKKSNVHYSHLVKTIKMKRAKYLLRYTNFPADIIAKQLGYREYRNFALLYKTINGHEISDERQPPQQTVEYSI